MNGSRSDGRAPVEIVMFDNFSDLSQTYDLERPELTDPLDRESNVKRVGLAWDNICTTLGILGRCSGYDQKRDRQQN